MVKNKLQEVESKASLFSMIENGALILTVNKRLARYIQEIYDKEQSGKGKLTWDTPDIYMVSTWIANLFQGLSDKPILSQEQAHYIWEDIISNDNVDIMHPHEGVTRVAEAYQIIHDYLLALPDDNIFTEEVERFSRWKRIFEDICNKKGFVPMEKVTEKVIQAIQARKIIPHRQVMFCGFDEIKPVYKSLIDTLEKTGSNIIFWYPCAPVRNKPCLVQPSCPEEEVSYVARWVRSLIEKGEKDIAVVVPKLGFYRSLIERIFAEELAPESVLPDHSEVMPFNISLGLPLKSTGLIDIALKVLECDIRKTPIEVISALLRSPYLGDSWEEMGEWAILDLELRKLNRLNLSFKDIINTAEKKNSGKRFARILHSIIELRRSQPAEAYPGYWARYFYNLLRSLKWPGPRTLDSIEYQTIGSWHDLLDTFTSLDDIASPMLKQKAIDLLKWFACTRIFQPESRQGYIQIMGILEASGMTFDHLWILGMYEDAMPSSPRPNPFLPISLQKASGVEHSSVEKELDFARRVMDRLYSSSSHIIASCPKQKDGQDISPSWFVMSLEDAPIEELPESSLISKMMGISKGRLESIEDYKISPLKTTGVIKGGAKILKDQAMCPFRAFAYHRLMAETPEIPESGILVKDRGTVIHMALEYIWKELKSSKVLDTHDHIEDIIEDAVYYALKKYLQDRKGSSYFEIEAKRTRQLLREWLDLEKTRPPFKIQATEEKDNITIGGLPVRIKIDRIDQLQDGKYLLIDYKTGEVNKKDWYKDRLTEPQLPLYALNVKGLKGITFAKIKPGGCKFTGIMDGPECFSNISPFTHGTENKYESWRDLILEWEAKLKGLAKEFIEGRADVCPVDEENTCRLCKLQPLCRITDKTYAEG